MNYELNTALVAVVAKHTDLEMDQIQAVSFDSAEVSIQFWEKDADGARWHCGRVLDARTGRIISESKSR
jgi:hypothetical protein